MISRLLGSFCFPGKDVLLGSAFLSEEGQKKKKDTHHLNQCVSEDRNAEAGNRTQDLPVLLTFECWKQKKDFLFSVHVNDLMLHLPQNTV